MSRRSKERQKKKAAIPTGVNPSASAPVAIRDAHGTASVAGLGPVGKQHAPRIRPRWDWLIAFALLAGVLVAYQPAWHAGFIWDDDIYVINNKLLTAPDGLWRIWFSYDSPSQYFPLVYTVFRFEHALWGLAPSGYHWVNIVLHGVNALLLQRLLARLKIPGAWLAAAIFALHPVQVESVAWVTELKNVQMGFFFLLSLLAWTAYIKEGTGRRWRYYALSLAFYALALCSKTTACTLPAALLLIAWLRGERIGGRRLMEVVPFVALGIGMGTLTIFWERYHQGTQGKLFVIGLPDRVLIAARAVWFYLAKLFWPANLIFSYPRWTLSPGDPAAYGWLLALCGLGGIAFFARRFVGRSACVALAFFVATLGPVLGFFMLYTFRYTFVADHYQYLACIGPIALVSAGMERLYERSRKRLPLAVPCLCAILLGVLGVLTWRQSETYRDLETLWRTTIARNPQSWLARNNLGRILDQQGRTEDAVAQYRAALQADPTDVDARNNLGNALFHQGRAEEAIAQYRVALQIDPASADAYYDLGVVSFQQGRMEDAGAQYREALQINPNYAEAHCSLGMILYGRGRTEDAGVQFREALRINPGYAEAHINLGNALLQQGRAEEAIVQYREALRINPSRADAHYNLGNALSQQGLAEEAIVQYREALRINPAFAEADNNIGLILYQGGRMEEAIAQYRAALLAKPAYVEAWNNLGNALFQQGRTEEAIDALRKALEQQPGNAQIQNNLAWMLATAPQASVANGARAVQLATQATQSTGGNNPVILRTLAIAYAKAGEFPDAIKTAQKALQLAQAQSNIALAGELRRDLTLYEAGRPFEKAR